MDWSSIAPHVPRKELGKHQGYSHPTRLTRVTGATAPAGLAGGAKGIRTASPSRKMGRSLWRNGSAGEAKRAVSKASPILRGTEGSNPLRSASQSALSSELWRCIRRSAGFGGVYARVRDGTTGEALQAIIDLDLDELDSIELPRGFGRD
jgi:hypothetical protein